MREHATPCVNATQFETLHGKHLTWEDSGICTRCTRLQDIFAQRREINKQFEEAGSPT